VTIFIMLSGFMIAMLITTKKEPYKQFIFRRFLRLYPVYFVCVSIAFVLSLFHIVPIRYDFSKVYYHLALGYSMLQGIMPENILAKPGSMLNPAWSISLEWQFYLVAPLLFLLIRKYRSTGVWIALALCTICLRLTAYQGHFTGAFLFHKISYFFIGIGTYFLFKYVTENKERLSNTAIFILPCVLLTYTTLFSFKANWPLFLWIATLAITITYRLNHRIIISRWAVRLLESKVLQWIGKISFSLYLIHEIVIWCIIKSISHKGLSQWSIIGTTTIATLSISFILCYFSYNYIELPFINLGKSRKRVIQKAALPREESILIPLQETINS
jgi:peptidoglycan/LPS O-acetylase OafA/YrhL